MKQLFIFLFLLSTISIFSQAPKVILSGRVFDRTTQQPLGNASYSINSKSYSTDSIALFRCQVSVGDTIVFSHVGYSNLVLAIEDSLQTEDYLTGVFLSLNTIQLSEVLVIPRRYEAQTLIKTNPVDATDILNAEKNVAISAYVGLLPQKTWDAESNQKLQLNQYTTEIRYKTQIPPNQYIGANIITLKPDIEKVLVAKKFTRLNLGSISTEESHFLTSMFKAYIIHKEEKEKNRP